MNVKDYQALTNRLLGALRNFENCVSERERNYVLSIISQVSYAASLAHCKEASRSDLEKMDFALKLVLDLIQKNPIPQLTPAQLQFALH